MKKYFLFVFAAILLSTGLHAQTNLSSSFTVNTTLTAANSPYVVTTNLNVNQGVTLTIENGVEIRFNSGTYLQVFGTLNATGTKFTANQIPGTKGFWDGIYVSYYYNNPAAVNLDNCTVEFARSLYSRNGTLTLKNSTVNNFSSYGLFVEEKGTLSLEGTTVKNTTYPIYLNNTGKLIDLKNNVFTDNTYNVVYINFSTIANAFNMPDFGIPYRVDHIRVTNTGTLTLSPGVRVLIVNNEFTVEGKIKAIGTIAKPITFEMHPDASYYLGMNITDSSIDTACIFKYCNFKSAKYDYEPYVAMEINSASPTFENCVFSGNARNLIVRGISKPVFSNCSFGPSILTGSENYNVALDMNVEIDFQSDSIKFNTTEYRSVKILPSTVIGNARLKKLSFKNLENITYCLYETTTVHDTASLVIDPGVVIKCRQYNSMIYANGTLTGIGTEAEPIIFTHLSDDTFGNPKDTQNNGSAVPSNSSSGRVVMYGKKTSKIENWKIHYGGYDSNNWAVYVSNANIVSKCEIKNSYRGIYYSQDAQILNNSLSNINYYPLCRMVNKGNPVLIGNTVSNVGNLGILIAGFGDDSPTLKPTDFAGITNTAYIIESAITIAAGNVVTIDPDVVIKFSENGMIAVNGAIKAVGKANNKIIFTSLKDDSASGDTNNNGTATTPGNADWSGIEFNGTASDTENILKNCEIRYCGYNYWSYAAAVRITDCKVVMDSIKVNFTRLCAMGIYGGANPVITNSQFYNLGNAPIHMDMFSNPTFTGNKVANLPRIGLLIRGQNIKGTVPVRSFAGYDTITYITEENLTVTDELTIPAGVTFKGSAAWYIRGKLNIQGTASKPVVFTSQDDDKYGSPRDLQQNGNTSPTKNAGYFVFYDEANDLSQIEYALFRYPTTIPIQLTNASPKILNTTFENMEYVGISLSGSSAPSINGCTFNNIPFPFTTSLVTYPAETTGNVISGTTGIAIRVSNETLTKDVTLSKRDFAGKTNIPYVFQNYNIGSGAKLTISPGVVCKFMQGGYMNVYNGLLAKGGTTPETAIVFTSDRDDFYGGDTYSDGDANLPNSYYWRGINFLNESIDENCILENCILKNASDYYYSPNYQPYDPYRYGAITLDNASPTIKNCLFESNYYGIIARNTSLPLITDCDFVGTDPTYGYGIHNQTATNTVTAENCWWNSNTGPRNDSNPTGTGERVSNYVDFTPWATQLAKPVLGDVSLNGEVKPFDASLVLQHAATLITLSAKQQSVADVSGNGLITSYDASLILQYSVGIISRFDPDPTKSASMKDYAAISYPGFITETSKKNFEIPLSVTTAKGIKALDMKYSFNPEHIKFVRLNKEKLPANLSVEAGFNMAKGELTLSMASAYDLNLLNQLLVLEFEFAGSDLSESQFSLSQAMANDYFISDIPASATIVSKSGFTSSDNQMKLDSPVVSIDHDGIHTRFELSAGNQNLFVQITDLSGKTVFRKNLRIQNSGVQYIDMPFADFLNPTRGIYILNMKAEEFSFSKKLLIK